MDIHTRRRLLPGILPLTILCLELAGCAISPTGGPNIAPDRLAASRICRDTIGLNPANAPHEQCVDSLLQNASALDRLSPAPASPGGGTKAGCAQFGLRPDSDAFANCVADLDAAIFEASHPLPG
jgi:hypothetical protein